MTLLSTAELDQLITTVEAPNTAEELLRATQELARGCPQLASGSAERQRAMACLINLLKANNPGAAIAAVDGLVGCGADAVEPLLNNIDARNYGARAWAVRALAGIGDARGLAVLDEAARDDVGPSVRRAAARGLGTLALDALPQEQRHTMQQQCLAGLSQTCQDAEWVVRYAAMVGLESLVSPSLTADARQQALQLLQQHSQSEHEDTLVVRLRALQALERLSA
ncbi:MAG: HEAT repeat domain-containing protein [Synechococcus sp.]|nr:HEAT repeat domain-containing protein [Synechococcus sp.]